jgi:acyl carrier protein
MDIKMNEKILEIINKVLDNRTKEKLTSISPEMHLRNDIEFDSLDLAELTVRIEAEYDIDIFEDGIVNTVGEILKKLKSKY